MASLPKPPAGFRYGWQSPLTVPAGRSGTVAVEEVRRKPGETVLTGNMRTLIYRGQPAGTVAYDAETVWRELKDDDRGTWMTDYPIEQIQHAEELKGLKGRVLVGGLGLGVAATVLARRRGGGRLRGRRQGGGRGSWPIIPRARPRLGPGRR